MSEPYAGDINPQAAWDMLHGDPAAILVDVRSQAEWSFVGLPDLTALQREPVLAAWAQFPGMTPNPDYGASLAAALRDQGVAVETPVLFLCRSGARSRNAAIALTGEGFTKCFNIAEGFEGDLDDAGHRGGKNGWKARQLPWRQT